MITSLIALVIPLCAWLLWGYLQTHTGVGMYDY